MGNCLARHSIRHVSGSSTAITTPPSSNPNSSERKGGIPAKTPQAQGDGGSREKVPSHTQSMDLPDSVAGRSNSSNYMHDFTYADLKTATRNFRTDSFLGEGGFGSVYRGNIDERTFQPVRQGQGIQVAVKKLTPGNFQGHNEWMTEVKFLGTLKHPNLVKLIGHCSEEDHRLLVYEFLTRGSLEHHLFGGRNQRTIPWSIRLKVAVDAARGLCFLHETEKPVIYRDFKAANILLDSDFNAKLSDFGLAKDGPTGEKSHVTTRVLGTYGYAAPEYVATGRLSAKSDVYSFGVVLLEILTGRRAVDKDTAGVERNLVEWAMPYLQDKRKWSRVLDQRLEGQYSLKGAKQAASIALHCLDQDPKQRPTMKDVLESLERVFDPKSTHKNSSSDPSSSQMRSPMRGSSSIEDSRADHHRHGRPAKQEQTVVLHPPTPANAFKLPSPQQMATK